MKKTITLLLCLMLVASMVACTGGATEPAAPVVEEPVAEEPVDEEAPAAVEEAVEPEVTTVAQPDGYPSQTIEVILPIGAGASLDLHFRALEAAMDLGGAVAIINMPGASQVTGVTEMSKRDGDGYNIGASAFAGLVIQPNVVPVEYSQADFRHIVALNEASGVAIATLPGTGLDTFDDILAKINSGDKLVFTTSNVQNVSHLAMVSVFDQLGISLDQVTYVPFSGTAEVKTALLGGHVDMIVIDTDFVAEEVKQGTMVCPAVLENERNPKVDAPSITEYGVTNMDPFSGFLWVYVPADTPDEIVEWLKQQMNEALMSDSYQAFLASLNKEMTEIRSEEEITAALKNASETYGALLSKYFS